jgi:hypothetical protein
MFGWLRGIIASHRAYRDLVKKANQAVKVDIPRLGVVHVLPMDPGMRLALSEAIKVDSQSMYSVYLWLIGTCIVEFKGRNPAQIGMDVRATDIVQALGDAVLDVSGMSQKGRDDHVKKSDPAVS